MCALADLAAFAQCTACGVGAVSVLKKYNPDWRCPQCVARQSQPPISDIRSIVIPPGPGPSAADRDQAQRVQLQPVYDATGRRGSLLLQRIQNDRSVPRARLHRVRRGVLVYLHPPAPALLPPGILLPSLYGAAHTYFLGARARTGEKVHKSSRILHALLKKTCKTGGCLF